MPGENADFDRETQPVRIPPNRLQKLNQLLRRLLVVAFAYFLLMLFGVGQALFAILAVFLLTAFATLSLYSFLEWVRSWVTTALRADQHGVTDATGTLPGGLVRWEEIAHIAEGNPNAEGGLPDEPVLLLHLHDTQAYLARLPEPKRSLLAASVPRYGTPCVVAQSDIGVPIAEARRTLEEARQRFAPVPVTPNISAAATAPTAHWWTAVPPEERTAQPLRNGSSDR